MKTYTVVMNDGHTERRVQFQSYSADHYTAAGLTYQWIEKRDCGDDGAIIYARWRLLDEEGREVDRGIEHAYVEPNHYALICAAGGDPSCPHEWTSAGERGSGEYPGEWDLGGGRVLYRFHCRRCGLRATENTIRGRAAFFGEQEWVEYEQPGASEE